MAVTGYRMFIDSGVYTPELNDDGVATATVIMPYHKGLFNGVSMLTDVLRIIDEPVDLSQDVLLNGSDLSPALKLV